MSNNQIYVKEKLLKLNGEYIKFYVTTNSKLYQLLANSGAAIIYHENNTNLNYIYVGGELIASGYGSKDIITRDNLNWWSDSYKDTLKDLYEKDQELDDKINGFYKDITEGVDANYVKTRGGNITKTVISLNDGVGANTIVSEDLYGLIENIKYDRFTCEEFVYEIKYTTMSGNIYTVICKQNTRLTLPIGSTIANIRLIGTIHNNDSGYLSNVSLTFIKSDPNMIGKAEYSTTDESNMFLNLKEGKTLTDLMSDFYSNGDLSVLQDYLNEQFGNIDSKETLLPINENANGTTEEMLYFNLDIKNKVKIADGINPLFLDLVVDFSGTKDTNYKTFKVSEKEEYEYPIYDTINILEPEHVEFTKELNVEGEYLFAATGAHEIFIMSDSRMDEPVRFWQDGKFPPGTIGNNQQVFDHYPSAAVPTPMGLKLIGDDKNFGTGFNLRYLFSNVINNKEIIANTDYVLTNSFLLNFREGQYTVMFTLPYTYEVNKVHYTNSQGDAVDITGMFINCGVENYIGKDKGYALKEVKDTNGTIISSQNFIHTHTRLYYAYSAKGFPKNFTAVVELRKLDEYEIAIIDDKFKRAVEVKNNLHIEMCDPEQLVYNVDFVTDHWYDADMSTFKYEQSSANDNISSSDISKTVYAEKSYNMLQEYLKTTAYYL